MSKKDFSPKSNQYLYQKIINEHENFKDKKYKELRKVYDKIRTKEMHGVKTVAQRMFLIPGIDYAYVFAGQNYVDDNLDRPIERAFSV